MKNISLFRHAAQLTQRAQGHRDATHAMARWALFVEVSR